MNYTTEQQVKNAIKWIEALRSGQYKQASKGDRGILGDEAVGYCCLGVGCVMLNVTHYPLDFYSDDLVYHVGLLNSRGSFKTEIFYGYSTLTSVNDNTNAGFKRISKFMRNNPEQMFKPEVAEGIQQHYQELNL